MLNSIARLVLLTLVAQSAFIAPAQACDIHNGDVAIFYDETELSANLAEHADTDDIFIGRVELKQKAKWFFSKPERTAPFYAEILSSRTHPALVGKTFPTHTDDESSTCRRHLDNGEVGLVKAHFLSDDNLAAPTLVLHGHIRRMDPNL